MQPTLIVSLDFELYWGMQDACPLDKYRSNILGARTAIPRLLRLFERHGIHATWASVGFLFARDADALAPYLPSERPTYAVEERSAYRCIHTLARQEPDCFFAPELLKEIAACPGQEIGTHTFSHFYCREPGQTTSQFEADMLAALAIAQDHGFSSASVVLPRNQCEPEYTQVLSRLGFTAYRDEESDWIHERVRFRPLMRLLRLADVYLPLTGQGGYIPAVENGIVNLPGSRMYKPFFPPAGLLEGLKIRRIKRQMLHAAKKGLTFHLWWHPHNIGTNTDFHLRQLEDIFSYYDELHETYGMRSLNMNEAAQEIQNR